MQPAAHGERTFVSISRPVSGNQMELGLMNSFNDPSLDQYIFSAQNLDVMYRFHTRTILSLGPTEMQKANQYIYAKLTYSVSQCPRLEVQS